RLAPGATVVFHDTGAQHAGFAEGIKGLISQGRLAGSFFPTPRGIFAGTVQSLPELGASAGARSVRNLQEAATKRARGERAVLLILECTAAALPRWRASLTCSASSCRRA